MRCFFAAAWCTASGSLLRVAINNTDKMLSVPSLGHHYGESKCPCVGFDNVEGTTEVQVGSGKTASYPADLGARCEAWDEGRNPEFCKGDSPEPWCKEQWCYVDPCKCDLPVIPKISAYLPDSKYQGKPVYYSYATCGGEDSYTAKHHDQACVNQKTQGDCGQHAKCLWNEKENKCGGKDVVGYCMKPLPVNKWGENNCRCVGIDNQPGTLKMEVGTPEAPHSMEYPADTGASCDAWDLKRHPDCKGDDKPGWCYDRWCYVDPCSCDHDTPPGETYYMPDANFQGKQIFFSYATCGTENRFSDSHTKKARQTQSTVCSSAWTITPFIGFVLMLASV